MVLSHLFIPSYMKLEGIDISRIDGGCNTGTTLSNFSKDKLTLCDTLFIDYDEKIKDLSLYQEIIDSAKEIDKEVIVSRDLAQKLDNTPPSWPKSAPVLVNSMSDRLYEIRVPVITVVSQGPRTDQLAVELAMRSHFVKQGYEVRQIGSHDVCKLFGFQSMPGYLYEPREAYDKTMWFNHYVKDLTERKQPELLIIGVPGPFMKYNDRLLNGMGMLPFIICNGVKSDISVACVYYNTYKKSFFEDINLFCQYRLNGAVQFFNIANTRVTPDSSSGMYKMIYTDLDSKFVLQGISNNIDAGDSYLFNSLDCKSIDKACHGVQYALAENVDYVV